MKKDVVLIGEAMGLFSAYESGKLDDAYYFSKKVAGAEVNVGIGLSRLGIDAELITRLGDDYFGRYILKFLELEGIGTEFISLDEDSNTGFMLKSKTDEGDPETAYYGKGSAFSKLFIEDVIGLVDFKNVNDTVGAGDGFAVGIISGYLDGLTLEQSTVRANAIGAIQVQNLGDNERLPDRETLLDFIEQGNSLIQD